MGVDIDGVIEVRESGGGWKGEIDFLDFGLRRQRYIWDLLFGYTSGLHRERILFDQRGLPDDVSEMVTRKCEEWQHSHSYATWAEVAAIDWDEPLSDGPDYEHVGVWRPGPDGELALTAWTLHRSRLSTRRSGTSAETGGRRTGHRAASSTWTAPCTARWSLRFV